MAASGLGATETLEPPAREFDVRDWGRRSFRAPHHSLSSVAFRYEDMAMLFDASFPEASFTAVISSYTFR